MTLISKKRPNYKTLPHSKHNIPIQLPMKPEKPEHVGEALKSELREYWIQCIYNYYDKTHNSTLLSCLLPRKMMQNKKKMLPVRLSFEVNIIDVIDLYELKCRICTNGKK